jgi:hypothetical protein
MDHFTIVGLFKDAVFIEEVISIAVNTSVLTFSAAVVVKVLGRATQLGMSFARRSLHVE